MKQTKAHKHLLYVVLTALFAALIAVVTAYIKVDISATAGYIHFGDSMIYLAACLLPMPYAAAAAAIGGGLADLLAGAAVWAPFTVVIKALNTLPFSIIYTCKLTKKPNRILNKSTAGMPVASGLITIFGYFVAEGILFGFESAAALGLLSLVQPVGSAILFYLVAAALDKVDFKKKIFKL